MMLNIENRRNSIQGIGSSGYEKLKDREGVVRQLDD